jgi:uroporphyrinogen III methyltransferase/synthase
MKGLQALKQADVVVYDHLVAERLLDHCKPDATIIYAGKEKDRHAKTQTEIERVLIRSAKAGKIVVRLKGGDPFLFGRGGEEAFALSKARVPYDVVPGVTSAIAVPAYAGIPVTHRAMASSVAMATGHEDPSKAATALDWSCLATATDTLVLLMGVGTLGATVEQLIRHGRAATTPCAVIEWGTWPRQRTVVGTLSTIVQRCKAACVRPPSVIVVGEVVRLRQHLRWFERKPLFGQRLVVTRPTDRADALAGALDALGAEVVVLPAIELAPLGSNGLFHRALQRIEQVDWVFFTSPEGIQWFQRLLAKERKDLRILRGCHIAAIGPKTASAIEQRGIHVDYQPATFSQEGLVAGLTRRRLSGKRALILSAKGARDVLEQGLKASGMDVVRVPIYQTVIPKQLVERVRRVFAQPADWVTVTSASCVEHLTHALNAAGLKRTIQSLRWASIGPVTSRAVRQAGGRVAVEARTATIEGLVEAIMKGGTRRGLSRATASKITTQ